MNSVQLHLALTHVPVILSLTGLVMLIISLFSKKTRLTNIAYIVILIAGITALPVFFSGEGAEEAVEKFPDVSEAVIEKHEDVAKLAMISIAAAGLLALAALFASKWNFAAKASKTIVLLVALASGGLMIQTAHLGGQIRHSEIRSGVAQQTDNEQTDAGDEEKDND